MIRYEDFYELMLELEHGLDSEYHVKQALKGMSASKITAGLLEAVVSMFFPVSLCICSLLVISVSYRPLITWPFLLSLTSNTI